MGFFQSVFGMPQTTTTNSTSGTKRTSFSSGKDTLSLTQGQIVKGEVTDLRSNEVTVRLEDGKLLHARLSTAMELSIGQQAEFFVQETNDVLITLKLLSDGDTSFAESAIDKALEASGFPKSQHAANIVRSLLTAGLPASKEMIQKMMQYSASNKDVELSTLTALLKHNLPVSKENATQLQAYRNFEHRLLRQASALTAALTDAFSFGEVSSAFTEQLFTEFFGDSVPSAAGNVPPVLSGDTGTGSGPITPAKGEPISPPAIPLPEQELRLPDTTAKLPTTNPGFPQESTSPYTGEVQPVKSMLSASDYASIGKVLDSLPPDMQELPILKEAYANGTLTADTLCSALSSAVKQGHAQHVTSLLKEEPALSSFLGKTLLNRFVLTPEDLTKKDAIEEFYSRVAKDLATFTELASGEDASAALKTAADIGKNMQENIQFMNTLNHIFPYVQLPLKLTEQLTHGELYVYTKKKDLSAQNKEVSILLHLDMDALGPTDIHLSLLQQSVTAKFYLNEPEAEALVAEQLPLLTEALQKKGYSLNASVLHRTKEPDIVADFLEDGDAQPMKRFRFDIRA